MTSSRPNTDSILSGLKDFQRDTVEYVFRRMYLDENCARRFLVGDEVGLGKTLVARGMIVKAIDHLWDRTNRIDVVYVCSNTEIARQNINRLNVTGCDQFSLSSRITLLPITIGDMRHQRVNFISFTPGTSFDLKDSAGMSRERELLYWLLKEAWSLKFNKATRVLHAYAGIEGFRKRVKKFLEGYDIHKRIHEQFVEQLAARPELRGQFDALCDSMPRAGASVPYEMSRERNQIIGELRRMLAETCLHWLEPDLIILDEFQRFKHLLQGDSEETSEAAQLAEHLFNFQEKADDSATAARVLLLSATPYKMYTLSHEFDEEDHYEDFRTTLDFLLSDADERQRFHERLAEYREELFRFTDHGVDTLLKVKQRLESSLRNVMVRTERLALKADRNGMLREVPSQTVSLKSTDIRHYLGLQRIADSLEHSDVLEYWKSAPYLVNFMENYDIKHRLRKAIDQQTDSKLAKAVRSLGSGSIDRDEIERYRKLDPANARLRSLHHDTVEREAWRLLWIPPSLPYYKGSGPFADPKLAGFTKRLVFSCWRVVPKAIASVLSYEAERCMMQRFRRKSKNTAEARKKRRALLRFTFSKGRPTGMPVLGMLYPCQLLAERFDPLQFEREFHEPLPSQRDVLEWAEQESRQLLNPIVEKIADKSEPTDERWYWAAPLLLDLEHDMGSVRKWFADDDLPSIWSGDALVGDHAAAQGWARHTSIARELVDGSLKLGQPPDDLAQVVAHLGIAGPGVVSLRTLTRILLPTKNGQPYRLKLRSFAAPLAYAFLHLFNLPEVMYLLRDRRKEIPYWRSVLDYTISGNLQSVLDEYAHILVESLGLADKKPAEIASEVCKAISRCLALRTSTSRADVLAVGTRRVILGEPIRMRTRFAMRFGDQDAEDSSEPTRADHVRSAFNSPFWPFVLATTSIGQEGLDFHHYCHAVVHWNLPSNPVDLEQREGRVHRYKGHAVRKNIAASFVSSAINGCEDPWAAMFDAARASRPDGENDLYPYWVTPNGEAKIERHVPTLPHSREEIQQTNLKRSLVLYRMVFGQSRQEDLVEYLSSRLSPEESDQIVDLCRINLSPPNKDASVESNGLR